MLRWECAIVLLLSAGLAPQAAAQPLPPEPPGDVIPPPAVDSRYPPSGSSPSVRRPRASLLGDPVDSSRPGTGDSQIVTRDPLPATRESQPVRPAVVAIPEKPREDALDDRGAVIGRPISEDENVIPVSATRVEADLRRKREAPASAGGTVDEFFRRRSADRTEKASLQEDVVDPERRRKSHQFGDRVRDAADGLMGPQSDWFRSDHAFDCYSSPITNPFLFEDPRSLTELRPIYLYQKVPSQAPGFNGGNIMFFGTQLRLAINERWSFVMNKLGGVSINPANEFGVGGNTGFAELWLGPKYTFLRNDQNGAVAAGGLQFQLPVGDASVFQNTGSLSLVPYLSYAHPFFRDSSVGTLNTMLGTGYAFSTTRSRSDYYYLSAHADLNLMNANRFFPMMELNWLIYTTNGNTLTYVKEGRDLINFGSQSQGVGQLTWAIGGRLKLSESAQVGVAYEIPIAGPKDLFQYRFTLDFILRY